MALALCGIKTSLFAVTFGKTASFEKIEKQKCLILLMRQLFILILILPVTTSVFIIIARIGGIDTYPVDITDLWQYGAFLCWSRMGLWQAWTMGDSVAVWLYSQVQFPFRKNDDHAQGELYPLVYQSQEGLVL